MANETTSTTLEEIINSEWIRPVFMDYVHEFVTASRFCLEVSLVGTSSATWAQPSIQSDMGTVGDGGISVATAYNATEGTTLANVQMDLTEVTISTSEYGIMRTITDTALEDIVDGFAMVQQIVGDAARILTTALEDDVVALFSSFTASYGSTGVNITAANLTDAIAGIRNRGCRSPGGLVAVVSDTQMNDIEDVFETVTTNWLSYSGGGDRLLGINPGPNRGGTDGNVLEYKGVPFFESGLVDTSSTGADDNGAVFIRGDVPSNAPMAAIGLATSREFRAEMERDASLRADEIVCTFRKGVGIQLNAAGSKLVTDA